MKPNNSDELGLGRVVTKPGRFLTPEGKPNVRRINSGWWESLTIYQRLLACPSWVFFSIIAAVYLLLNIIFGIIYFTLGSESFSGIRPERALMDCIFFSAQTLTTVGYGGIHPIGIVAGIVSAIEAFVGLLMFAVITGLLFARFSKAKLQLIFSDFASIGPYKDITALMFRFVNRNRNELFDLSAHVTATWIDNSSDIPQRRYQRLKLEQDRIVNFYLNWTVCHPIDESSPLLGLDAKKLEESDFELIINLTAYDDLSAQNIRASRSYKWYQIKHGPKFLPMYWMADDGTLEIDLKAINKISLPTP